MSTPTTVAGPRSTTARPAVRPSDRAAMRRMLEDRGFEHAVPTIADVVATAVEPGTTVRAEERLSEVAGNVEAFVIDALVLVARRHGWRPA